MKKIILLGFVLILFMACQEQKPQRYFADSPEIETLKSGITAYESGDWDAWKSHFADTAKIFVNSIKPIGVEERANGLQSAASALSSYGFNRDREFIEMVLDKEDETWVYYWAAHKATFAASGNEVVVPVHLAVQFLDGKIVEEHVYYDGTSMNAEFAAMEAAKASEEAESVEE